MTAITSPHLHFSMVQQMRAAVLGWVLLVAVIGRTSHVGATTTTTAFVSSTARPSHSSNQCSSSKPSGAKLLLPLPQSSLQRQPFSRHGFASRDQNRQHSSSRLESLHLPEFDSERTSPSSFLNGWSSGNLKWPSLALESWSRSEATSLPDASRSKRTSSNPKSSTSHVAALSTPLTSWTNTAVATTLQLLQAILEIVDRQWTHHNHARQTVSTLAYDVLARYWWTWPAIVLCGVVPLQTMLVSHTLPVTPEVWKLVNMDFVHTMTHAMAIVTAFLASNLSYFVAAAYLLYQSHVGSRPEAIAEAPERSLVDPAHTKPRTSPLPMALGGWVLAAGCMSTIFHTVQAWGDFRLAEALCYLDHGVAGTAILYFWYACGRPSARTWVATGVGLATLAFPVTAVYPPLYPWLHATWHVVSAATALVWAQDAVPERLAQAVAPTSRQSKSNDAGSPKVVAIPME